MSRRSYEQYCATARALDVLGDRWTLLVLRELLDGPKRYVDLLQGLRTISTDVLARRLRDLAADGLVERETLPPPAASQVYRLTERGRDTEPVILALARFGFDELGDRRAGDGVDPRWLSLAVRSLIGDARPATDLTVRFETPDGDATVRITADGVQPDAAAEPDVVLAGPIDLIARAVDPDEAAALVASGALEVTGHRVAVRAFAALFDGVAGRPAPVS
jgi:DNA-binding HxlR family transcriptional regulator